jgi:four helix bundle protein
MTRKGWGEENAGMEDILVSEDNEAWQKARELLREVYEVSNAGRFAIDFSFCERLRWSAMAIMLSIADGMNCGSSAERRRFLDLAQRAAQEFVSVLSVAWDRRYLTGEQWASLTCRANEIVAKIGSGQKDGEAAAESLTEEAAGTCEQGGEAMVIRPDLLGWCRGYSADTGLWGWKLQGDSHQR